VRLWPCRVTYERRGVIYIKKCEFEQSDRLQTLKSGYRRSVVWTLLFGWKKWKNNPPIYSRNNTNNILCIIQETRSAVTINELMLLRLIAEIYRRGIERTRVLTLFVLGVRAICADRLAGLSSASPKCFFAAYVPIWRRYEFFSPDNILVS